MTSESMKIYCVSPHSGPMFGEPILVCWHNTTLPVIQDPFLPDPSLHPSLVISGISPMSWSTYDGWSLVILADRVVVRFGVETCYLVDRLLTCNPGERITATQTLEHDYFWTDSLPADSKTRCCLFVVFVFTLLISPSRTPVYEASHEFDKRWRHQQPPQAPIVPPCLRILHVSHQHWWSTTFHLIIPMAIPDSVLTHIVDRHSTLTIHTLNALG